MFSSAFWIVVNLLVIGLRSSSSQQQRPPLPPLPPSFQALGAENLIVGGNWTTIEEYPWQVSLQYEYSHFCGGSIIDKNWILTSARCANWINGTAYVKQVKLRLGSSYHEVLGFIIDVKRSVVHEKHNPDTVDYDFALLELTEPLQFTNRIQAVNLPNADAVIEDGLKCKVSGFGSTKNSERLIYKLRTSEVPIFNQENCNYQYDGRVTDRMICAGYDEGGVDLCQGDHGGGLILYDEKPVIIGIASWNIFCGEPKYPGVYSRISSVREWIKQVADV